MKPRERVNLPWVIGGHDAAVICGRSQFKTPLRLWAEKLGKVEREDLSDKPVIKRGNALEPHLLELYEQTTGRPLLNENGRSTTVQRQLLRQHPAHPWAVAPLDGVTMNELGQEVDLDAKTANIFIREQWGERPARESVTRWWKDGEFLKLGENDTVPAGAEQRTIPLPTATEIPLEYAIQLQHYMWVTGRKVASFAVGIVDDRYYREPVTTASGVVVFGLTDFLWCDMKRNDGFIDAMERQVLEFVTFLESDKRPPAEFSWRDHDWFARLVGPEAAKKEIELDGKAQALVAMCHAAINTAEKAEQDKQRTRVQIMDMMGDAAVGILPSTGKNEKTGKPLPGKRIHFKTQKTKARLVECSECGHNNPITKERSGRVLRVPNREKKPHA